MKLKTYLFWAQALALTVFGVTAASGAVTLPAVIGEHMVVQRDVPLPVWGWAAPGEEITVCLDDKTAKVKTDEAGNWKVVLPAMKADGVAHRLTIAGNDNTIDLTDVLVGEVWIGSGQSNMEWGLSGTHGGAEAVAAANYPEIRLLHVPKVQLGNPAPNVNAAWKVCTPQTVPSFSAVLYHFGRRIHSELKIPVGLINSAWPGSPIEPWIVTDSSSGGMYNGMIAPLQPFPLRGVIWYQGETNCEQGNRFAYFDKMKELITGWRKVWGQELSFYFVQIAPWSGYGNGLLPDLWEAQSAALTIPRTGMAVITDLVDNIGDIHPRKKEPVGLRLAPWALAGDYGREKLVYSGPAFESMQIEKNTIRVKFVHTGGGLKSRDGGPLTEFQVAGADGTFVPAEARIDGGTVIVAAEKVPEPAQVRFGWHKAANPNLINAEGLPAAPFQSNNWRGGTGSISSGRASE